MADARPDLQGGWRDDVERVREGEENMLVP